MRILTPITMNPGIAFLVAFRWDKHLTRARRQCRIELRRLTREIGQRYAQEQTVAAQADQINQHWRAA